MFDRRTYQTIFEALFQVLKNNGRQLGVQFCEGLAFDYDPNNGGRSLNNAERLFNHVSTEAQRLTGSPNLTTEQLFQVVGNFVTIAFEEYRRQVQPAGGFGINPQNAFGGGSIGGGGFNGGSAFSNGNRSVSFGQQQQTGPGSHLADDTISSSRQSAPPKQQNQQPGPVSFDTIPSTISTIKYVATPLDDVPTTGVEFNAVPSHDNWGPQKPTDRRIMLGKHEDLKTRDSKFTIARYTGSHQLILDDPMDVVRDFFKVVPDTMLGIPFMFRIGYNHLTVIDVPTEEFVKIRTKCIEAIANDRAALLHKTISEIVKTMPYGIWEAMSKYLVEHINRALHLASRTASDPSIYIKITDFNDIDLLLSSAFHHKFTAIPEGRYHLERVVGAALWNAIALNVDVMFTEDIIPTNAMQSSPAFPFSMEGVYPTKFTIPTSNEDTAIKFLEQLREHELSRRSYVLSRRAVVITNILGKNVLPKISKGPAVFNDTVTSLLNFYAIPFAKMDARAEGVAKDIMPFVSEEYSFEQLESYYSNPREHQEKENEVFFRKRPPSFPVDQTIFAVQYGVKPEEYLQAFDVFTTIEDQLGQGQVILAKKAVPTMSTTA